MGKTRQYNIEGVLLKIPLCYDELAGREIEIFPDFIENPVYTPEGCPMDGAPCTDCGSCRFYRQTPDTLIGVCGHEQKRRNLITEEKKSYQGGTEK